MERVKPILEYPVPKTKRQLTRFLGMAGWYSRFIEKESEIKLPLLKLIKTLMHGSGARNSKRRSGD